MSNKTQKHTPKPWTASAVAVRAANGNLLCHCYDSTGIGGRAAQQANARLIAAAPELLEFAETMGAEMNCICKGPIDRVQKLMGTEVSCGKCQAEAAIRKVKGKQ